MAPIFIVAIVIGAILSIVRRGSTDSGHSLWSIINNDFWFDNYATIPLLSFLYAIAQGSVYGCIAASIFSQLAFALKKMQQDYSWCEHRGMARCDTGSFYLYTMLLAVASLIVIRLSIEGCILVYKAGQVFIDRFGEYEEMPDTANTEYEDWNE